MEPYEIIDLKPYFPRLEQYDDIAMQLTVEEQQKIVGYIKQCHTMSYRSISKRYDHWAEADAAHDVYIDPEATDFREMAVIPDTRAIADTVITYMMAALGGRNPMFQLEGLDRTSRTPAMLLERVMHQQMRRTAGEARLAQHLLDIVRYGMAPTKVIWNTPDNQNNIINFEPRKTFPDPRVTWGDWDKMSFLIFSDHISFEALHRSQLYDKLNTEPLKYAENIQVRNGWEGHRDISQEGRGFNISNHTPRDGKSNYF